MFGIIKIVCIFAIGIVGSHDPMTRAKLAPPFPIYIGQDLERVSTMKRRLTLENFVERATNIHKGKYGYSLVNKDNFKGSTSIIPIICPQHGVFPQRAGHHLRGCGCKTCAASQPRSRNGITTKYGGITDVDFSTNITDEVRKLHGVWCSLLERCNGERTKEKRPTYKECSICEEWKYFSNFLSWTKDKSNGFQQGYNLDKDILVKGNKVYSPETCCFVPQEINKLIIKCDKSRSDYPLGVSLLPSGKFLAKCTIKCKGVNLGTYDTPEEAFFAYKQTKEKYIQEVATEYYNNGKITEKVYNALMNYKVEITD